MHELHSAGKWRELRAAARHPRLLRRPESASVRVAVTTRNGGSRQSRTRVVEDGHYRVDELVNARNAARKAKDFKEADRIRDELAAMGIELKDAKDPKTGELVTTWEVAR